MIWKLSAKNYCKRLTKQNSYFFTFLPILGLVLFKRGLFGCNPGSLMGYRRPPGPPGPWFQFSAKKESFLSFLDHILMIPAACIWPRKNITILKFLVLSKNHDFSKNLSNITKFPKFGKLLNYLDLKNTLFQLGSLTSKDLNWISLSFKVHFDFYHLR